MQGRRVAALAAAALGAAAAILLASTSVWTVSQNESGVVLRFGRAERVVPSGICMTLPWPMETLIRVATTEVRTMPIGFRLTARARGLKPTDEELQWLTGDTNIVELQATIQYTVSDPAEYLFGMADPVADEPRDFGIRKVGEAVFTALVAKRRIDDVLASGKVQLQIDAIDEVQALLDTLHLGVRVTSLNIVEVTPPAAVIGAFNDVSSAKADRERTITEARGDANRTLPVARAEANRMIRDAEIYRSDLLGRARGAARSFAELSREAASHPAVTRRRIWLEAMEKLLPRTTTKVIQPPSGDRPRRIFIEG